VTDDGGISWTSQPLPSAAGGLSSISCRSTAQCVAVGGGIGPRGGLGVGLIVETTDGGAVWTSVPVPVGIGGLDAVSCAGPDGCVADGVDPTGTVAMVASTTNGGSTWLGQSVPNGVGGLTGVACPSKLDCFAVGSASSWTYIVRSSDGGGSWSTQSVPNGVTGLTSIACGSVSDCVAVGAYPSGAIGGVSAVIVTTKDGGATWTRETTPSGLGELYSVSCAAAVDCVAVGWSLSGPSGGATPDIVATTDGGATWTREAAPSRTGALYGVSCSSALHCVAVGDEEPSDTSGAVLVTTDGGTTWSYRPILNEEGGLTAVSCPTPWFCLTVGEDPSDQFGLAATTSDGGASWKSRPVPKDTEAARSVSCASATVCVVLAGTLPSSTQDAASQLLAFSRTGGRTSWAVRPIAGGVFDLMVVSCPATSTCEIVGLSSLGGGLVGHGSPR
jgi:photosystem II stability/assembly factor-like uncharacterized protein